MRDDQQRRTLVTKRSSYLENFIRKMKKKHYYPLRPSEIRLNDCANTQREPNSFRLSLYNKFDKQFGGPKGDEQEINEPYIEFNSSSKALKRPVRLIVFRFQIYLKVDIENDMPASTFIFINNNNFTVHRK